MLLESIKMAFNSLRANKMRALLTMLGIIVGIASVIAIVALGEGGKNEVLGEFEQIGASTVNIRVRSAKAQNNDYITQKDIEAIRRRVPTVKYLTAALQALATAASENQKSRIMLAGIDEAYNSFASIDILAGRLFTEMEYADGRPAILIDRSGAEKLFGRVNAVGEVLTIDNQGRQLKVTVVGVCESITSQMSGLMGTDMEQVDSMQVPFFAYLPFKTAGRLIGGQDALDIITVMSTAPELTDETGAAVIRVLESRHGNESREVYRAQNMASVLEQINNVLNILTIFISAVAAISLLVGGIGVMNIMLVSVTERTREIGIRKAIGATTTDIMMQFITESVIMTFVGGVIGVLAGLGLAYGIALAVRSIGVITPVLQLEVILIAVIFASSVGLFFGIYPARKAAGLDPIDALRYE